MGPDQEYEPEVEVVVMGSALGDASLAKLPVGHNLLA